MPRALRIEYPGAIYHVMNRGDRREPILRDDWDHKRFLATLAEACTKTDWQGHAFCLLHRQLSHNSEQPINQLKVNLDHGNEDACGEPAAKRRRQNRIQQPT